MAAPAADVGDRVCLKHNDRSAVARCHACRKPMCAECRVEHGGVSYCSTTCAERSAATGAQVMDMYQRDAARARAARRRNLIIMGVVLVLALVALGYVYSHPQVLHQLQQLVGQRK